MLSRKQWKALEDKGRTEIISKWISVGSYCKRVIEKEKKSWKNEKLDDDMSNEV